MAIDPEAPTAGPHAPVQVFPAPGTEDSGVTATSIRELRDEVLQELQEDTEPAGGVTLNVATKVALTALLLISCTVIGTVLYLQSHQIPAVVVDDAAQPTAAPTPVAPAPAPTPAPATPAVPETTDPTAPLAGAEFTSTDARLAEIDVLAALVRDDPSLTDTAAITRLQPYLKSDDAKIKAAAEAALKPVAQRQAVGIRGRTRALIETAQDQLEAGAFGSALQTVDTAITQLKQDPLQLDTLLKQLENMKNGVNRERDKQHAAAFEGLESGLMSKDPTARTRMNVLLKHPDAEFAKEAAEIQTRVSEKLTAEHNEFLKVDAAARAAWIELYAKFTAAVSAGDVATAANLLKVPEDSVLLKGGVKEPAKVLAACAADLAAMKALQDAVLEKVTAQKSVKLDVPLKRGVEGTITGVDGRQLVVSLRSGGETTVKVESISPTALANIVGKEDLATKRLLPALWVASACENPQNTYTYLKRSFDSIGQPVPENWAAFHVLEEYLKAKAEVDKKFAALQQAVTSNNGDTIKEALTQLRPAVVDLEAIEPLSPERRAVISDAEKQVGRSARMHLMLQNGLVPTPELPEYRGNNTDQITDYKDSVKKTDVGVQWGLKVGASGGVQRVLLRFDGLEDTIGKARVISATLEMYQIDSPQYAGAVVGLFRLKKAWVPDSGSWMCFNTAKGSEWSIPGARGVDDVEAIEDTRVSIDKKVNTWRAWDVTKYVQDVLTGKQQNNGFLMRVINGEPDYHVRFYPETDIENRRDPKLRPRLTLEIERDL